jgi:hypothetical protein
MSPWLHPVRWLRADRAHEKVCNAHAHLCRHPPVDFDAITILWDRSKLLFEELMDWLG